MFQDEGHQEEADLQDHQEEDHLVPLAHLEIVGPQGNQGPPGPPGP